MSSGNRSRAYESGYQKRKKKQRVDELIQSQRGAMDRFIKKEPQVPSADEALSLAVVNDGHINNEPDVEKNVEPEAENNDGDSELQNDGGNLKSENNETQDARPGAENNHGDSFQPDIFDPRYWDSLHPTQIDILAKAGPKRDLSIQKGPKDRLSRRLSALFYTRILPNGEHCDRDWLVYSKELDKVFCFSCKLFRKGHPKGQLTSEGYNDWTHLGERLSEHETGADHVLNMSTWYELRSRLQTNQTIDKSAQRQLEKEKDHR